MSIFISRAKSFINTADIDAETALSYLTRAIQKDFDKSYFLTGGSRKRSRDYISYDLLEDFDPSNFLSGSSRKKSRDYISSNAYESVDLLVNNICNNIIELKKIKQSYESLLGLINLEKSLFVQFYNMCGNHCVFFNVIQNLLDFESKLSPSDVVIKLINYLKMSWYLDAHILFCRIKLEHNLITFVLENKYSPSHNGLIFVPIKN